MGNVNRKANVVWAVEPVASALERHEEVQTALRMAWALCHLCRGQFEGTEASRAASTTVLAVLERIQVYLETAAERCGDFSADAAGLLRLAMATISLYRNDAAFAPSGHQHLSDEICSWIFWSLDDDLEQAAYLIESAGAA